MQKQFKILSHRSHTCKLTSVPWDWIKDHEEQAKKNHYQSLEQLNSRGGLSPLEMYAVKNNIKWSEAAKIHTEQSAAIWIEESFSLDKPIRRLITTE